MPQTDNVVFIKRDRPLIDSDGYIDETLDEISRHFLLSYAHDLQTYGVVDLTGALGLIRDGVLKFEEWGGGEAYFNNFTVVNMTPEYLKCYMVHLEELEFIPTVNKIDPYLRPIFQESAADVRFDGVYLMTEQRLRKELETGDRKRLIYKTPYRPELLEEIMELSDNAG